MTTANAQHCKVEGCKRGYRAKGYCNIHFNKWRKGEMPKKPRYKTCVEEGCRKPYFQGGKCETHYNAMIGKNKPAETTAPAPAAETAPAPAEAAPAAPAENAK